MNDLLKVLDMSKEEQVSWLRNYAYHHREGNYWHNFLNGHISLADLAFRLRDEAIKIKEIKDDAILPLPWLRACYLVVNGKLDSYANVNGGEEAEHKILKRNPIYWIIAALIAKEKDHG